MRLRSSVEHGGYLEHEEGRGRRPLVDVRGVRGVGVAVEVVAIVVAVVDVQTLVVSSSWWWCWWVVVVLVVVVAAPAE